MRWINALLAMGLAAAPLAHQLCRGAGIRRDDMTERSTIQLFSLALAGALFAGVVTVFALAPAAQAASPFALGQPAAAQSESKSGGLNKDWGNCSIHKCDTGR